MARRLRRRAQLRPQDGRLRLSRHGPDLDDVFGRRRARLPGSPVPHRLAAHVRRRLRLRALSGPAHHARFQRSAARPPGAGHARGDRRGVPENQRDGHPGDGARERKPVDGQHPARRHLSSGEGSARRRRRAHPFTVRRPRREPRVGRCAEPRLEARRRRSWRDAGKPARHLHRRAAAGRRGRPGQHVGPGRDHAARSSVGRHARHRGRTSWDSTTSTGCSAR